MASQKNSSSRVGEGGITDGTSCLPVEDGAHGGQLVDAFVVVPQLLEDAPRVLAGHEGALHDARGLGEVEEQTHHLHVADDRVPVLRDPALLDHLRVVEQVEHEIGRRHLTGHAGSIERGEPLAHAARPERGFERVERGVGGDRPDPEGRGRRRGPA